ncbi:hypothetical protein COS86_02455 [Candidatus Bathyarchaeota archaeon CG07_land_8_20_14_0_80_47_9]|nr:MAG: hypothetical protein COS86_02455 [Candidatus Bathyarchaeota archaeon CG07_land_8_20_14_0_80_47_9]
MSLRRLYGSISKDKRICNYYRCQRPILRNIDRDKKDRLYHHGCFMAALDEQFRCLNCYTTFDATEGSFETVQVQRQDEFREKLIMICPNCGSHNLKRVKIRHLREASS